MKVGLLKSEYKKYDEYNGDNIYSKEFEELWDEIAFLDFKKIEVLKQIKIHKPEIMMGEAGK